MKKWLNDPLLLTISLLFRKDWSLHLGKGSFGLHDYCYGAEIVIFITGKLGLHSHIFWTWVSVWIYVLYRFCVCLMFEMFMCLRSKKDLCVCVQELLPIKVKKRTTRSKKADEKQLVKMKSGELMSSKVKASKHINKPVLMLF